jgi:hypothetical protein
VQAIGGAEGPFTANVAISISTSKLLEPHFGAIHSDLALNVANWIIELLMPNGALLQVDQILQLIRGAGL